MHLALSRRIYLCAHILLASALAFVAVLTANPAAGGQIDATWKASPAIGNWNVAGNWDIGIVPNNGADTYRVFIDGTNPAASTVSVNATITVDAVLIDANDTLSIDNGRSLTLTGGTSTNAGTIGMAASSSNTYLKIGGAGVTLTGGGTVSFSDSSLNRIAGSVGSERLTNLDNTIRGSGNVGSSNLAITNSGTIEANQASDLTIDPGAGGAINTGFLQGNGGTLVLQGGTFTNNTGGTIRALTGSTVELSTSATIVGGTLTTAGTGVIRVVATSAVLQDLTNAGQLSVDNGRAATLLGTIQNTGTIGMAATSSNTYLKIGGTGATLTGGGTVSLSDSSLNRIAGSVGGERLTNLDNTIRGSGNVGSSNLAITNSGTIEATQTSDLTVDPGAGGAINTGFLQGNGGTLVLQGGTFTNNTGGTIRALTGSTVELSTSATIVGGTLTTAGTGVIRVTGNNAVLQDLTNAGQLSVNNGHAATLLGTIQNTGTVGMAGTSSNTYLRIGGTGATLTGGGTVSLANSANNHIGGSIGIGDERLTNQDNTIQGSGSVGSNTMAITNRGTIEATQTSDLIIDPVTAPTDGGPGFLNEGVARATNSATLQMTGGTFTNAGTILATGGGTVNFSSSAVIANYNNVADPTRPVLTGGAWKAADASEIKFYNDPKVVVNAAEVALSGAASVFKPINQIDTNAAAGKFRILDGRNFTTLGKLDNSGIVEVGVGSTLSVAGRYSQATGGMTTVNGILTADDPANLIDVYIQNGTIGGSGTVQGQTTLVGTVAPGNSIGTLSFEKLSILDGSAYDLEISGATNDRTEITGLGNAFQIQTNVTAYTVDVTISDYAGALGQHVMFHWAGDDPLTQGEFDHLSSATTIHFPTGVEGQIRYNQDSNTMYMNLTALPEPATLALMGLGLAGLARLRRRNT